MKELKEYLESREKLLQYFDINIEDNTVFEDLTKMFWQIDPNMCGKVRYAATLLGLITEDDYMENDVLNDDHTQRVYRGEYYTAIRVDTNSNDVVYFQIFENSKKIIKPKG